MGTTCKIVGTHGDWWVKHSFGFYGPFGRKADAETKMSELMDIKKQLRKLRQKRAELAHSVIV